MSVDSVLSQSKQDRMPLHPHARVSAIFFYQSFVVTSLIAGDITGMMQYSEIIFFFLIDNKYLLLFRCCFFLLFLLFIFFLIKKSWGTFVLNQCNKLFHLQMLFIFLLAGWLPLLFHLPGSELRRHERRRGGCVSSVSRKLIFPVNLQCHQIHLDQTL